jgi:DNA primase
MNSDLDIVKTIEGEGIELRQYGRECVGLCPFHDDSHPSLYVNREKGVFLCRSCGACGDAIDFVRKLHGCSFKKALEILNLKDTRPTPPPLTPSRKMAAEFAASWVNDQRSKFNIMIADTLEQRDLADEIADFELAESFDRELVMLWGFYDALGHLRGAVEILALRESIEFITSGTEVTL